VRQASGELLKSAKAMRREMTPAEARLWYHLRAGRFQGVKFKCQVVIARYIADFAVLSHRLVIEVDGDTHAGDEARDERRTAALEACGYRVVRFTNAEVAMNLDGVLQSIGMALTAAPLPNPLPTGEREKKA
jgi:very-short-patch-repair endonuclease